MLAARLTEDPAIRVLLLEAGPEADADEISIPVAFSSLFKTKWDWNYTTTEQKQLHGRRAYWPRMKALGGCSSMNAMIYIRGNRADYDGWRDEYGATGWGYDDVLPYFIRAEGNTRLGAPYHGQDGPLHVEDRVYTHELSRACGWTVGGERRPQADRRLQRRPSRRVPGSTRSPARTGAAGRPTTPTSSPARQRPNLDVETGALATRIDLEGDARDRGDLPRSAAREVSARAGREVLLCGGAVNSPQLLMLSGIGPAAHLREHGHRRARRPGRGRATNLQDHPAVPMIWYTRGITRPRRASATCAT